MSLSLIVGHNGLAFSILTNKHVVRKLIFQIAIQVPVALFAPTVWALFISDHLILA